MADQELYFEVFRRKSHYFLNVQPTHTVKDLKLMLHGITKIDVASMELWKLEDEGRSMLKDDTANMTGCGYTRVTAKPQSPAQIGLRVRGEDDRLIIDSLSVPPPIPEVMEPRPENEDGEGPAAPPAAPPA